jgi:cobalt-zinc-cadmium efflux system membrane fusion protein
MTNSSQTANREPRPDSGDSGIAPPWAKIALTGFFVLAAGVATAFVLLVLLPGLGASATEHTTKAPPPLSVELVSGKPHTLSVPEDVQVSLGIRKGKSFAVVPARVPAESQQLVLSGSTALDPSRLVRIRARFTPVEVVEIAKVPETTLSLGESLRELAPGDQVKAGDRLLVFYSVDVGQKKNDLIDALVQLRLDQDILTRAEAKKEVVPEVFILNARRNVEADQNAIARALNTLRTWDIPKEDIQEVQDEAERLAKTGVRRDHSQDDKWARVEVKAKQSGTIIERNVSLHEIIVDPTISLFQIAEVDRIQILANASEDELARLLKLPVEKRRWTIRTIGERQQEGISGAIEEFSYVLDANQRSAVIKGRIVNPKNTLRAGQYITASIDLPAEDDIVEIPVSALIDDGKQCVVFVQEDAAKPEFTLRRVDVVRRFEKTAHVRSRFTAPPPELTRDEKDHGFLPLTPLKVDERVLTAGILELKKELEDREAEQK